MYVEMNTMLEHAFLIVPFLQAGDFRALGSDALGAELRKQALQLRGELAMQCDCRAPRASVVHGIEYVNSQLVRTRYEYCPRCTSTPPGQPEHHMLVNNMPEWQVAELLMPECAHCGLSHFITSMVKPASVVVPTLVDMRGAFAEKFPDPGVLYVQPSARARLQLERWHDRPSAVSDFYDKLIQQTRAQGLRLNQSLVCVMCARDRQLEINCDCHERACDITDLTMQVYINRAQTMIIRALCAHDPRLTTNLLRKMYPNRYTLHGQQHRTARYEITWRHAPRYQQDLDIIMQSPDALDTYKHVVRVREMRLIYRYIHAGVSVDDTCKLLARHVLFLDNKLRQNLYAHVDAIKKIIQVVVHAYHARIRKTL